MDEPQVNITQSTETVNPLKLHKNKPQKTANDWVRDMRMSAAVNKANVGVETEMVTPDLMLATSKKLLGISKREQEPDPKDSLAFQRFYGPEMLFSERIQRDGDKLGRNLLWKATNRGNLDFMPTNALEKHISSVFYDSKLAQMMDGSSPLETIDSAYKTTRIGEGGVSSQDSAPEEMRTVQPSYFGFIDPVRCFAVDTELMTETGWKKVQDITGDDKLACLINDRLEYHKPTALNIYDFDGTMYGYDDGTIGYLVTPNHRMYSRCADAKRDGSPCAYNIRTAEDIHGTHRMVNSGKHLPILRNEDDAVFHLPQVAPDLKHDQVHGMPPQGASLKNVDEIDIVDFAEYMGWYLSEGCCGTNDKRRCYQAIISQSPEKNPANYVRIKNLIERLPFNAHGSPLEKGRKSLTIARKQLVMYLLQFGKSDTKFIPDWIFKAPLKARLAFREAMLLGDGRDQRHLCTMSKQLAEDFARLQFELGESVYVYHEPEKRFKDHPGIWVVYWHKRKENGLQKRILRTGEVPYYTEQYKGKVYCPTVPGGLVYQRKSNKHTGFWIGQSPESFRVGLDVYMTKNVMKGTDGKLYQKFIDAKTGKEVLLDSETAANAVIAAPEMMQAKTKSVFALGGPTGVRIVPRDSIQYYLPRPDDAYSTASNLVTMLSGVKEMRLQMGCLHPDMAVISTDEKGFIGICKAKNLSKGVIPGSTPDGISSTYDIRTTVAKFAPKRNWFVKVVLKSGRSLITSSDHRWPVLRNDKYMLVEAAKLKAGDVAFRSSFKDVPFRRTFVNGIQLSKDMAKVLGYIARSLNEPDSAKMRIEVPEYEKEFVLSTLAHYGFKDGFNSYYMNGRFCLGIRDITFKEWLRANMGAKDEDRKVPACVMSAGPVIISAFLDGYTADATKVGMDSNDDAWVLFIQNLEMRDSLAFLFSRLSTDCLYRDTIKDGQLILALKLRPMEPDYGDMVKDPVKVVIKKINAPFMVDIDINDNLYAVANGVVTHNSKYPLQAVSIQSREAPLVRGLDEATGKDMHSLIGKYLGARFAPQGGIVTAVRKDRIDVIYDDGTKGSVGLYVNFPMNAKGFINNTPVVKAGQSFKKGDVLASSNYTDDKGTAAIGTNLRAAWMSWKGGTYEDAIIISESAAKKLTSDTMYKTSIDLDKTIKLGKSNYATWKPAEFNKEQLANLDDSGIVKPGTVLHKEDPMILAVQVSEPSPGTMGKRILTDVSERWEHDHPGVVTDVVKTKRGIKVFATVTAPAEVGDKLSGNFGNKGEISQIIPDDQMPHTAKGDPIDIIFSPLGLITRCYDEQTEFLTKDGWKFGKDIKDEDELYCYNRETTTWHWGKQEKPFWRAPYDGLMYGHKNDSTDFLVTPGHRIWCSTDYPGSHYSEKHVEDIYGKRYIVPCVGSRRVEQPVATPFELPAISVKKKDTHTTNERVAFDPYDWAEFLGWYLAEGNTTYDEVSHSYRVNIAQFDTVKPHNVARIAALLDRLGFTWNYGKSNKQFHINNKRLAAYLRQFGHAWEKYAPEWLFKQPDAVIQRFIESLMLGDGNEMEVGRLTKDGRPVRMRRLQLTSERLIDQVQQLLCMLGVASTKRDVSKDKRYKDAHPMYRLGITTVNQQTRFLRMGWYTTQYSGMVYCPTVDTGYILTRRNGKIICLGNTNPSQLYETLLGKVAHKTGKPIVVTQFMDEPIPNYVDRLLKQYHVNPEDDVIDPDTGRVIKGVTNGYSYIYKLKHLAESKMSARGTSTYDAEGVPGGKGMDGSKRFGMLESSAMAGHGAFDIIKDSKYIRGQSNSDFWRSVRTGDIPTMPGEPLVHKKFFAHLTGAGVNVRKTPQGVSVFALTNQDVNELAGSREVKSRDTYETKSYRPIDGGLFGQDVFGINGDKWGYIQLDEPMPNPVMEEPLARLLNIPDKKFSDVVAGRDEVNGIRGPVAMKEALNKINLTVEAERAQQAFKNASPSNKDKALKRYIAIERMRRAGINPAEYMLDRIPVLPPVFRPITSHNGLTMVADSNYLYAQLLDARDDIREAKHLPKAYQQQALENMYTRWKELTGLYAPNDAKLQSKHVQGLLKWALGDSPKFSSAQRKVISATVDTVGRGVVVPDPRVKLNELGLPVEMAFNIMAPFVQRALVQRGYSPIQAMEKVKARDIQARDVLNEVMKTHPVLMNRAPTLHKLGIMAYNPRLVSGHAIHVNPSTVVPFNMDFDGDTVNIHVPVSDKARQQARDRMFPERNLLSMRDREILYKPEKEYQQGLYIGTRMKQGDNVRTHYFDTVEEARKAFRDGIIDIDDPIEIRHK